MFEEPEALPLGGAWDEALLGPVSDINERLIECLRHAALALVDESAPAVSAAVVSAAVARADSGARAPALLAVLAILIRSAAHRTWHPGRH